MITFVLVNLRYFTLLTTRFTMTLDVFFLIEIFLLSGFRLRLDYSAHANILLLTVFLYRLFIQRLPRKLIIFANNFGLSFFVRPHCVLFKIFYKVVKFVQNAHVDACVLGK